jgi:hypothetical protein
MKITDFGRVAMNEPTGFVKLSREYVSSSCLIGHVVVNR